MNFRNYFIYLADYQHWANDALFNALDRLDDATRTNPNTLYYGNIHDSLDHLAFFFKKWHCRLKGEPFIERYSGRQHGDWRELKNTLRHEIRELQHWLEQQPDDYFDHRLTYQRTLNHQESGLWVRDALTHMFTYAALERGHIATAATALGAPNPDMSYYSYRMEMGEHLDHLRKGNQ